ncbi:hypothetical protein PTQ21_27845 [Paenibacillus marchantiae]|uniref:hypothetical protein n=1 Tax=Paenibacillus marchantiae TaxID=3026433 RepID=UPI00237B8B8C|nr:hypothetical protein [Paenibacillus marchantiae]WDQ32149.1 hypothetical protein PTQ21_27845 [Paenibacillus marchantiae]
MDFSIEYVSEKIYHPKSKEYFQEVISSYHNGNYRSALVMLYSVTICDLLYKVTDLKELYNDQTAISIMSEVEALQKANSKSSEWETKLVDLIQDRTSLINVAEKQHIENLRLNRHLSAHPVVNENYILYAPNKESVRAHIRNILESVLIKPPLLSKKITIELLEDLARLDGALLDDQRLKRYLETKYLRHFVPEVESKVFRDFWKMVFKTENDETTKYRDLNYRALKIMYERNHVNLLTQINNEKNYYSDITLGVPIEYLISFLTLYNGVYNALNEACKALIERTVENSRSLLISAWFLQDNIERHIDYVKSTMVSELGNYLDVERIRDLIIIAEDQGLQNKVYELNIAIFANSYNFDQADYNYSQFIKPYIKKFNKDNILSLLKEANGSSQIYNRSRKREESEEIKEVVIQILGNDFDLSEYSRYF